MLHSFGVAYFEWGWIITTILGGIGGALADRTKRPNLTLFMLCVVVLIIGGVAFYGKYRA